MEYQDRKVVLRASLQDEGFVVLLDTFYPGWKAYVDGEEKEILHANYAYRAVRIEGGEHEVVFRYDPVSYKIGKAITIMAVVIIIGLTAFQLIVGRKRRRVKPI
jgi:uncharacterized membrane protein YfhO